MEWKGFQTKNTPESFTGRWVSWRACGFFTQSHINHGTRCHRMWWTTKRCSMSLGKSSQWFSLQILGEQNWEQLGSALSESLRGSSPFLPEWVTQSHHIEMQKPFQRLWASSASELCPFHLEQAGGGAQCEQSPAVRVILDLGDKELKAGWWNGFFSSEEFCESLNPNNSHCISIKKVSWSAPGTILGLGDKKQTFFHFSLLMPLLDQGKTGKLFCKAPRGSQKPPWGWNELPEVLSWASLTSPTPHSSSAQSWAAEQKWIYAWDA